MFVQAILILLAICAYFVLMCRTERLFYRQLYEMENVFQQDLSFVPLTKGIFSVLLPRIEGTGGFLFWKDEIQDELKIRTVKGIAAEHIHPAIRFLKEPNGLIEQVINSEQRVIIKNHEKINLPMANTSWLGLPLRSRGCIKGVLVVMKKKGFFSKKSYRLAEKFAERCGVHLENAHHHEIAVDSARENARLYLNISRLYQQATHDELTNLFNRSFALQRMREEAKKSWRYGYDLSLVFLDIDHFKQINDHYGHGMGDQVLVEISRIIHEQIRDYDIACRFGGEEFVIILPQTGPEGAQLLAQRIRRTINDNVFGKEKLQVTASFGVASLLPGGNLEASLTQGDEWLQNCLEELISRADTAMYVAKDKGRNRVEVSPPLEPSAIRALCLPS